MMMVDREVNHCCPRIWGPYAGSASANGCSKVRCIYLVDEQVLLGLLSVVARAGRRDEAEALRFLMMQGVEMATGSSQGTPTRQRRVYEMLWLSADAVGCAIAAEGQRGSGGSGQIKDPAVRRDCTCPVLLLQAQAPQPASPPPYLGRVEPFHRAFEARAAAASFLHLLGRCGLLGLRGGLGRGRRLCHARALSGAVLQSAALPPCWAPHPLLRAHRLSGSKGEA